LNNGFKMLIDNLNETLNILFQSTLVSVAENVENGIKGEFQTLCESIYDEINDKSVKTKNNKLEEELPIVSNDRNDTASVRSDVSYLNDTKSTSDYRFYPQYNEDLIAEAAKSYSNFTDTEAYYDFENDNKDVVEPDLNIRSTSDMPQGIRDATKSRYFHNQNKGKKYDGSTGKFVDIEEESEQNNNVQTEKEETVSNTNAKSEAITNTPAATPSVTPAPLPPKPVPIPVVSQPLLECNQCKYTTKDQWVLNRHIVSAHQVIEKSESMEQPPKKLHWQTRKVAARNENTPTLECTQCKYVCKDQWVLTRHIGVMAAKGLHVKNNQHKTKGEMR